MPELVVLNTPNLTCEYNEIKGERFRANLGTNVEITHASGIGLEVDRYSFLWKIACSN